MKFAWLYDSNELCSYFYFFAIDYLYLFHDKIGAIDKLVFGKMEEKREAVKYLVKLAVGWVVGMLLAVVVLSSFFDDLDAIVEDHLVIV